jgi:hypothetical protein
MTHQFDAWKIDATRNQLNPDVATFSNRMTFQINGGLATPVECNQLNVIKWSIKVSLWDGLWRVNS